MTQFISPSRAQIEQSFQAKDDTLLSAMAAAFGLVACSDAVLEHCEVVRFFEVIRTSEPLSKLPWSTIETQFADVTDDILKNGASGRENALSLVTKVRGNDAYRDAVVTCARIAVVANFQIQDVEERALREVCTALGVDPKEI